jgi:hypothetical protein
MDLTGIWIKEGDDGVIETVNILEISQGYARAIGKNFTIEELKANWKRGDAIIPNPFAATLVSKEDKEIFTDNLLQDIETKDISKRNEMSGKDIELSPEMQFIQNAISLNKTSDELVFSIKHLLSFSIDKISAIAELSNIDLSVVADAIVEDLRKNPEVLFESIKLSVYEKLEKERLDAKH